MQAWAHRDSELSIRGLHDIAFSRQTRSINHLLYESSVMSVGKQKPAQEDSHLASLQLQ